MLLLTGLYDLNNDFIDLFFVQEQYIYIQELCNLLDIKMPIYKAKIKQNFELQTGYKRLKESYGDKL